MDVRIVLREEEGVSKFRNPESLVMGLLCRKTVRFDFYLEVPERLEESLGHRVRRQRGSRVLLQ